MPHAPPAQSLTDGRRRGALLLLVLSMLTLFLMIGIFLLVTATRTRLTARAFSEATNTTSQGGIRQRALLDEALMRLIRGPTSPLMSESILEDTYGRDFFVGQLMQYSLQPLGVIQASIGGLPPIPPNDLAGRVVTFQPQVGDDAAPSSYRILSVAGTTFQLANLRLGAPVTPPRASFLPCRAVINGRAFTPVSPRGTTPAHIVKLYSDLPPSPSTSNAIGLTTDDGVYWIFKQGKWQQYSRNEAFDWPHASGIPGTPPIPYDPWLAKLVPLPEPKGAASAISASFASASAAAAREVDNDNDSIPEGVWLKGLFPDEVGPDGGTLQHSVSYTVIDLDSRANVNAHGRGPGGPAAGPPGPADLDCVTAFGPSWSVVLQGGPTPLPPQTRTERRETPWLSVQSRPNRAYDVFGRVTVGTTAPPPNPYALDVGPNGRRPMLAGKAKCDGTPPPVEAVYGVGELERLLRPFDADARALPCRLALAMGPEAEAHRLELTTDTWDTGGLLGQLVPRMLSDLSRAPVPPPSDIRQGLRFNLNSPVSTDQQRQIYFEGFMSVLMALHQLKSSQAPEQECAQWVANIVDFLDSDNTPSDKLTWNGQKYVGLEPGNLPTTKSYFLGGAWNLGRFASEGELLAITFASLGAINSLPDNNPSPQGNRVPVPEDLPNKDEGNYKAAMRQSLITAYPELLEILDFICVTSPFNEFSTAPAAARWREPGRLNVNTCTDKMATLLPAKVVGPNQAPSPQARSLMRRLLDKPWNEVEVRDFRNNQRPELNKVLNTATTRSNVFAIWITLRTENTMTGDQRDKRLFAIIDRSIPVGFLDGADLNAADIIRLKRHID